MAQRGFIHEQLEMLDAIEEDDRDAFEIRGMQRIVGRDIDLGERRADALQDGARVVAQMAAGLAQEDEAIVRTAIVRCEHYASARSPEAYASSAR